MFAIIIPIITVTDIISPVTPAITLLLIGCTAGLVLVYIRLGQLELALMLLPGPIPDLNCSTAD